jgi:hypothetical protein
MIGRIRQAELDTVSKIKRRGQAERDWLTGGSMTGRTGIPAQDWGPFSSNTSEVAQSNFRSTINKLLLDKARQNTAFSVRSIPGTHQSNK